MIRLAGVLESAGGARATTTNAKRGERVSTVPKRHRRKKKHAAPAMRLLAFILMRLKKSRGAWIYLPALAELAEQWGISERTLQRALNKVREKEDANKLRFLSKASGAAGGRGRVVAVAAQAWLKYDQLPLFETKGRKLRPWYSTFRRDRNRIARPISNAARPTDKNCPPIPYKGKSPADNSTRTQVARPETPAKPEVSLSRAAWRAAREAMSDGDLAWDNAKPKFSPSELHGLIFVAFRKGYEWRSDVRPALRFAIRNAHSAACLSGVRNPAAFAATIFRQRLAEQRGSVSRVRRILSERQSAELAEMGCASLDDLRRKLAESLR